MATKKKEKEQVETLAAAGPEEKEQQRVTFGPAESWKKQSWADSDRVLITWDTLANQPGTVWDGIMEAVSTRVERYLERADRQAKSGEKQPDFFVEVYVMVDDDEGMRLEIRPLQLSADDVAGFGPSSIARETASNLFSELSSKDLSDVVGAGFAFYPWGLE